MAVVNRKCVNGISGKKVGSGLHNFIWVNPPPREVYGVRHDFLLFSGQESITGWMSPEFPMLIEAAKIAPHWNPQLAAMHERELKKGNRNRATLAVARRLVAYMLAVEKKQAEFTLPAEQEAA
jgi:hypothetical protein